MLRWLYRVALVGGSAYWIWSGNLKAGLPLLALFVWDLVRGAPSDELPELFRGEVFTCGYPTGWRVSEVDGGGHLALRIDDSQGSTCVAAYLLPASAIEAARAELIDRIVLYDRPGRRSQRALTVAAVGTTAEQLKQGRLFGYRFLVTAAALPDAEVGLVFASRDRLSLDGAEIEAIAASLLVDSPRVSPSPDMIVFPPHPAPTDRIEGQRLSLRGVEGWDVRSVWMDPPGYGLSVVEPESRALVEVWERPWYPSQPADLRAEVLAEFYPGSTWTQAYQRTVAGQALEGLRFDGRAYTGWVVAGPMGSPGEGAWLARVHCSRSLSWGPVEQVIDSVRLDPPSLRRSGASNPGRFQLSTERLFALQPGLLPDTSQPVCESEEARRFHVWMTGEHLRTGDSRAAVVVGLDPPVIAAYTDELDCVALLRFPDEFGSDWSVGDRMVTTNRYQRRTEWRALDLVPGPHDTGTFGEYAPYIADLLTDDESRLAERKASIPEHEWTRCAELGRAALARGQELRDGRPPNCSGPGEAPTG